MKLLRDFVFPRVLRRLRAGRRAPVRRSYTVTVPAPLAADSVVGLSRPQSGALPHAAATRHASFAHTANP